MVRDSIISLLNRITNRWDQNCSSKVAGVSHACGHDGHVAMLVGAAKVIASKRALLRQRLLKRMTLLYCTYSIQVVEVKM